MAGWYKGKNSAAGDRMKKVSGQEMVKEDIQELMRRLNIRMEGALRIFGEKEIESTSRKFFSIGINHFLRKFCRY